MKRFFLHSPIALLSFLLGISSILFFNHNYQTYPKPLLQKPVKNFAVNLERINLDDITFVDAVNLGNNKILSLSVGDGMRVSKDGGKTWERMFIKTGGIPPQTGGFTIYNFDFINSQKGWASGNAVISTNDGGETWEEVKLPRWMHGMQVKFLNESLGYVAGSIAVRKRYTDITIPGIEVYKTVDGGKTWRKSYSDKTSSTPWDITILDENTVLQIIDGNILLRTENGGKSWQKVYERLYGGVSSISKSPDGKLWLFGKNNILTSIDSGKTWQKPENLSESLINHDWWSVDFNETGLGAAVSEDAAIALTKDGGKTWSKVKSNLHVGDKIPVRYKFDESLRRIHLYENSGIIFGSQRDYIITFPE